MTYKVHLGGYSGSISKKIPCGIGNFTLSYQDGVVEKRQGTHERGCYERMDGVFLVEVIVVTKANGYTLVKVGGVAEPLGEQTSHLL